MLRKTCIRLSLMLGLGLCLLAGRTHADVMTAVAVPAVESNFIRGGLTESGQVQNWFGDLYAKDSTSAENVRKVYLKFDLSGYDPLSAVASELRLTTALSPAANFALDVCGLKSGYTPSSGKLGYTWTESALTWNNAPGNTDGSPGYDSATAVKLASFAVSSGDPAGKQYAISLGNLSSLMQPDGTATLFLIVTSQDMFSPSLAFVSSGNSGGPTLLAPVPEPSALALLFLAGLSAWMCRYRCRVGS